MKFVSGVCQNCIKYLNKVFVVFIVVVVVSLHSTGDTLFVWTETHLKSSG